MSTNFYQFDENLDNLGTSEFIKVYKKEIKGLIAAMIRKGWYGTRIPAAKEFGKLGYGVISWACEEGHAEIALKLGVMMIADHQRLFAKVDDSGGYLGDNAGIMKSALVKLFAAQSIEDKLKKEMFKRLLKIVGQSKYFDNGNIGEGLCELAILTLSNEKQLDELDQALATHIDQNNKDDWYHRFWVQRRNVLLAKGLLQLGKIEEFEKLFEIHPDEEELRIMYAEYLVKNKNIDEAIQILEQGIELAESKEEDYKTKGFRKKLIPLYFDIEENDKAIHTTRKLFFKNHEGSSCWTILREKLSSAAWKKERSFYIEKLGEDELSLSPALMSLLEETQDYKSILNRLQYASEFWTLDSYFKTIPAEYQDDICNLYLKLIPSFLEHKVGRKYYRVAARYLKKVIKMGAEMEALKIIDDLKIKYKNRPSLLEELNKI